MSSVWIQAKSVGFGFAHHPLFHHLSLSLSAGEMVSIMGPSGSGKSTLLRMLSGFIQPDTGQLIVQKPVALVSQDFLLLPHLSARRNIALAGMLRGQTQTAAYQATDDMLAALGLHAARDLPAKQLSHGQAQRVALLRAIQLERPLLLLDEPTASLDPNNQKLVLQFLRSWLSPHRAILFISHQAAVAHAADRCLYLHNQGLHSHPAREI